MLHHVRRFVPASSVALSVLLLAACSQPSVPAPPVRPTHSNAQMVASIRAAGDGDDSVINVHPLRDPGVASLLDVAQGDERVGKYDAAVATLDQALKLSPNAPDLLQERAEAAVYLSDYATAERLANQSWTLGPKFGPLCARNWQTIVEMRTQANDEAGAATARKWVQQCHKAGIKRL
jgi:tetratricopeptide (TPR) repeat protein